MSGSTIPADLGPPPTSVQPVFGLYRTAVTHPPQVEATKTSAGLGPSWYAIARFCPANPEIAVALSDILKTRKANKIHKNAWAAIWQEFKDPPEDDQDAKLLHVLFVGTLLYATRVQSCLAAGMEDAVLKAAALKAVVDAGYDETMRDEVLLVFSAEAVGAPREYAEAMSSQVASVVAAARAAGTVPLGSAVDNRLADIKALLPVFAAAVGREG